jgi:hypothetical protein
MPSVVAAVSFNTVVELLEIVSEEPLVEVTEYPLVLLADNPSLATSRGKVMLASAVTLWAVVNEF